MPELRHPNFYKVRDTAPLYDLLRLFQYPSGLIILTERLQHVSKIGSGLYGVGMVKPVEVLL